MNQRSKGELLCTIGAPPAFGITAFFGTLRDNPVHCLWAIPLTLLTLPLLPFYMEGEKILSQCDKEDFEKATAHLPKVTLPEKYSYIDNDRQTPVKEWYAIVNHYDEFHEFSSEEEVRKYFLSNGFQEVVAYNYPDSLETYWLK